jgi:Lrp/AsnC family transcriptional regulator for asnA, asnC and gidA
MSNNLNNEKNVDELDLAIITILKKDSRTKGSTIAKRVGSPERTVRDRIKRLVERGVIKRFTVQLDFGYSLRSYIEIKVLNTDTDFSNTKALANRLKYRKYVEMIAIGNDQNFVYILVLATGKKEMDSLLLSLNDDETISYFRNYKLTDIVKLL